MIKIANVFKNECEYSTVTFWPRGFADAVLGTAYLLFLLLVFLFLEKKFNSREIVDIHCTASRLFQKVVEIIVACPRK